MNKKLFVSVAIVALMGVVGYLGHAASAPADSLSDLTLANAEALAESELTKECGGCATNYTGRHCCNVYFVELGIIVSMNYPGSLFS